MNRIINVCGTLLLVIGVLSSCDRAENYLPKASQSGENTAGWMIQDYAYKQSSAMSFKENEYDTRATMRKNDANFSGLLFARSLSSFNTSPEYHKERSGKADDRMYIYVNNIPAGKGTYTCKDGIKFRYEKIVDRKSNFSLNYYSDSLSNGTLEITAFDPAKKIISGTFTFDAALAESSATNAYMVSTSSMLSMVGVEDVKRSKLSVRKGRFDMVVE